MLKPLFISWKSVLKSDFLSVTAYYISDCFGIDPRAFSPTSYRTPTRPAVILSILPAHILPTLLSTKLRKHLLTCKGGVQNISNLLCVFSSSVTHNFTQQQKHQVSVFLPTACVQYMNHGRDDVPPPFYPHTLSHTPTRPLPPLFKFWSQTSLCVCCCYSLELSRLTWHWSQFRGEESCI